MSSQPKRKVEGREPTVYRRRRLDTRRPVREYLTLFEPTPEVSIEEREGGAYGAARDARPAWYRLVDVLVAGGALLLLSPIIALIAIAIRLESRGPVIYRQLRVGLDSRDGDDRRSSRGEEEPPDEVGDRRDGTDRRGGDLGGRPFFIYKFRTMKVDAESETGPVWCTGEDSRITRVGRFLRRHRLDEIPQFVNVLKGEMSVVGPRPERPAFFQKLRSEIKDYPVRQKVRPGITGWAQINRGYDRSLSDVHHKLIYDLEYIRRRSFLFDLRIMFETVFVMMGRKNPFRDLRGTTTG